MSYFDELMVETGKKINLYAELPEQIEDNFLALQTKLLDYDDVIKEKLGKSFHDDWTRNIDAICSPAVKWTDRFEYIRQCRLTLDYLSKVINSQK